MIGCNERLITDSDNTRDNTEEILSAGEVLVARVYYPDRQKLAELAAHNAPWEVHPDESYAVFEIANVEEIARLESEGYTVEVDYALTEKANIMPSNVGVLAGIPGYPCYRTVEETFTTASQIAQDNPNLATWSDIGNSWEKQLKGAGYDINVLVLTNKNITGTKPILFVMSAIHAREYTTAELVTRFAEYLVDNYGTDPDATWLLDYHEIHLVLQANPDGRKYAEGGQLWRKNTNENYCGATSSSRGADLNRNYPFEWGGGGSSGSQCSSTYRGPNPESEPETQAITAYVRSIFPDQRDEGAGPNTPAPADATGVFFDIHSYSELVLWPWGYGYDTAPNNTALRTFGRKLAYFNDYKPQQSVDLYPADGVTIDTAYGELGVASYVFELGTSFFQACSTFENTILPDNLNSLLYAAKVARTPYLTPAGPDALNVAVDQNSVPQGTIVRVNATFDDTRFSNNNGTEPRQNIAAGNVYVDVPPWEAGASGQAMTANDGSFNENIEAAYADINTSSLAEGNHILFVQGRDANGSEGAVGAVFLTVTASGGNLAPTVTITSPADGTTVGEGTPVDLAATASDPEDGDLTASIVWTSSIDGNIATGGNASVVLSVGTHLITASVTDSGGLEGSDSVTVTVTGSGTLFSENFDSGSAGWTTSGLWHLVTNSSCPSPASGSNSPPNAMYYGQDSSCNYSVGTTIGNLVSPSISGIASNTVLSFAYFREVESYNGTYDITAVDILHNAGSTTVFYKDARDASQSQWVGSGNISLADYAGQSIQIRFRFDSRDGVANNFTGWLIDDVLVTNP
ncbi:MAG: Ig-like domain-containing protein [Proteobacteria bacterium]|nr:Ig-like domain-containing protein [Pseudomonadota bacterium]